MAVLNDRSNAHQDGYSASVSSICSSIGGATTTFASITTTTGANTGATAVATSTSYQVPTSTSTGSSKNVITRFGEMDQIKETLLSGYIPVIVLILQTYFYFVRALSLGIIPASASPMVLFKQVLQVDWQEKGDIATGDFDFHATLDHQYSTDILVLSLDPPPGLFNTTKIWQGPNSSRKMSSLTSFPMEVHHYTIACTRRIKRSDSSSHNQPLTFLPSVCPYSTVSTGHHSKKFVSTYSKT